MPTLATRRTFGARSVEGDKRERRWGLLQVKPEYLQCGNWIVPNAQCGDVLLFEISSLPLDVLRTNFGEHQFQFMIIRDRQLRRKLGVREHAQAQLALPEFPVATRMAALLAALSTGIIGITR